MRLALLVAVALAACRNSSESKYTTLNNSDLNISTLNISDLKYLPDRAGSFVAGPPVTGAGFVRRVYARGAVRIDVTVARQAMDPAAYAQWEKLSAGYPAAALDAPAGAASGFYDCSGAACSLHAQTRGGVHLEVMGGGTATRADLDDLVGGLPVRALAGG